MHRQIVNSTLIYFSMIVLQALIQIILLPFQTHFLTPNQFGVLATVIAVATLCAPLFNLGLLGAAQRFSGDFKNDSEKIAVLWTTLLWLSLISGVLIGIILLLVTSFLPIPWHSTDVNLTTIMTVITHAIGMGIVLMCSEFLRMIHQPYRYAIAITLMSVSYCVMNLIFIGIFGWALKGALLAFAIMPIIGFIAFIITNLQKLKWIMNSTLIKEVLVYSIKVLPHFSFTTLNTLADRLLIVLLLGKFFAGIYTVGTTMASAMLMLVNALSFSIRPHIFAKFNEQSATAFFAVRQLSLTSIIVIALAGANMIVWAPEIVTLLTSNAYHDAWQITILLTLKFMVQGISLFVVCSILFNKKKVHELVWISVCSLTLLFVLSVQLAPHFGIWSVAIAGLAASIVELLMNYAVSKKTLAMNWPLIQMISLIMLFIIPACGLVAFTYSSQWSLWEILLAKGSFSVLAMLSSVFIISKQTKSKISSILSAIIPRIELTPTE